MCTRTMEIIFEIAFCFMPFRLKIYASFKLLKSTGTSLLTPGSCIVTP